MSNLILGIIDNYKFHEISNFLLSLKNVTYSGHVCLFAGPNISPRTFEKVKKFSIELISYQDKFPFISKPHQNNFSSLPDPIHIYNFRHFLYYDYLLKNHESFKNVLITDVKDVIFQKDPFDLKLEDKIYVAVENLSIPLGSCEWNSNWIIDGYGDGMLEVLKDKEIICAGTTLAPVQLMMKYLKRLIEEFFVIKDAYKCADQAMHNVLIHFKKIAPICRSYNFEGPILTVGTESTYLLNAEKNLITKQKEIIPIVHQYDRHHELIKIFKSKTGSSNIMKSITNLFKKF